MATSSLSFLDKNPWITDIPNEYLCPITGKIMVNPAKSDLCGHRFDLLAIRKGTECPIDGRKILEGRLIPDAQLKRKIKDFIEKHPELFDYRNYEELVRDRLEVRVASIPRPSLEYPINVPVKDLNALFYQDRDKLREITGVRQRPFQQDPVPVIFKFKS